MASLPHSPTPNLTSPTSLTLFFNQPSPMPSLPSSHPYSLFPSSLFDSQSQIANSPSPIES